LTTDFARLRVMVFHHYGRRLAVVIHVCKSVYLIIHVIGQQ